MSEFSVAFLGLLVGLLIGVPVGLRLYELSHKYNRKQVAKCGD